MNPRDNPFAPGAGTQPPELAGRSGIITDAAVAIARARRGLGKSMLLLGLRGVGKTVLLNKLAEMAQTEGCLPVVLEAPEDQSLAAMLVPVSSGAQGRRVHSMQVDSLTGSPAAFRTSTHRLLLDAGFSVREVAACDCLLATDTKMVGGEPVEIRVHILRPPNGILVRVVIQALVGTGASTDPRSAQAAPVELRNLLERLRDGVQRSRLPR
jgi:hypothetical protein